MTNKMKIAKLAQAILEDSYAKAKQNVIKAINSGAIDTDAWDEKHNPMLIPKAIVIAVLNEEADQYSAKGTSFEKFIKKESKNIGLHL